MSYVMPFVFNAVELCVVTINEKSWTRAKEACRALEHNRKATHIVKIFCSRENYGQRWQLNKFPPTENLMNCPKDSRKDDYYINEEGMYKLVFGSQQPKTKNLINHCCNVMFPQIQQ